MKRSPLLAVACLAFSTQLQAQEAPAAETLPPVGSAGGPSRELRWREAEDWLAGRREFARERREEEGLGEPGFNARSCAFCHKDPALGGAGGPEVDVLSPLGTSHYDPGRKSKPGDGNRLEALQELRKTLVERGQSVAEAFDVRQTPSLLGLGLIDSIPDEEILRNEDPEDRNRDGVRGVAGRVTVAGETEVGRFGWKAEVPRLADFVCRALGGELGVTAPDQGRGFGLAEDRDRVPDPETSQEALDALGFFVAHLAAPQRTTESDPGPARRGELLFERLGCSLCHVPALYGGEGRVELYSDLLLHEIRRPEEASSPKRVRNVVARSSRNQVEPDPDAETRARRFRTAPLWGVGRTAPYLHDGSAKTLAEAVLAHDAEAAWTREGYEVLVAEDQQALVAFLASL